MKMEMEKKVNQERMINNELLPKIKEISTTNVIEVQKIESTESIKKLREFEANSKGIAEKTVQIKQHNQ